MGGDEWLHALKCSSLGPRSRSQHATYLDLLQKLAGKPLDVVIANPDRMRALMREKMTMSSLRAAAAAVRALGKHGEMPDQYAPFLEEWGKMHAEASRQDIERARGLRSEKPMRLSVAQILAKEQQLARESPGTDTHLLVAAGAANIPRFLDLGMISLGQEVGELGTGEARFVVPPDGPGAPPPRLLVRSALGNAMDLGATPELCEAVKKSFATRPRTHLFVDASGNPFSSRKVFIKWASTRLTSAFGGKKASLLDVHRAFAEEGVHGDAVKRAVKGALSQRPQPPEAGSARRQSPGAKHDPPAASPRPQSPSMPMTRGVHVLKDGSLTVVL